MVTLISLIQSFQSGNPDSLSQILERMTPLVKKYAGKIHCMEYEDALQELYLTLLESINYLDTFQSEGKCVKYMETCIINRYYALCKHCLSIPETDSIDDSSPVFPSTPAYDDTALDIDAYISSLPKHGYKQQILSMFFYNDMSDKDIATQLGLSRQYVNRIKKQLIKNYFEKYPR